MATILTVIKNKQAEEEVTNPPLNALRFNGGL